MTSVHHKTRLNGWSAHEENRLRVLWLSGGGFPAILAGLPGRSRAACEARAARLKLGPLMLAEETTPAKFSKTAADVEKLTVINEWGHHQFGGYWRLSVDGNFYPVVPGTHRGHLLSFLAGHSPTGVVPQGQAWKRLCSMPSCCALEHWTLTGVAQALPIPVFVESVDRYRDERKRIVRNYVGAALAKAKGSDDPMQVLARAMAPAAPASEG